MSGGAAVLLRAGLAARVLGALFSREGRPARPRRAQAARTPSVAARAPAPEPSRGPAEEPATRAELAASDARIFARIAAGERDALGELYDRHGRWIFSLVYRVLRDREASEDALQEVFLKVWSRAEQFDARRGSALAWLGSLARHHAIDRTRAAGYGRGPRAFEPDEETVLRDAATPGPDRRSLIDEDISAVRSVLAALPSEQRVPLELAYFDGLSQSEIASRLEAPLGTVKTRMRAGLKEIRERLAPRFEEVAQEEEEGRS